MNQQWLEHQVIGEAEREHRRFYWLRLAEWTVLAAGLLFVAGLFFPKEARAESRVTAPDGTVVYIRHDAACDDADILKYLVLMGAGERIAEFKKGTLNYEGRSWRSCWLEFEGNVFSVDEEGAALQPIPARLFRSTGA